jgi:hypothetical protein
LIIKLFCNWTLFIVLFFLKNPQWVLFRKNKTMDNVQLQKGFIKDQVYSTNVASAKDLNGRHVYGVEGTHHKCVTTLPGLCNME